MSFFVILKYHDNQVLQTAFLNTIATGGRQEALYVSNYSIICINYDLISVSVGKDKHADLQYEIICGPFRATSIFLNDIWRYLVRGLLYIFVTLIDQDHVDDAWLHSSVVLIWP